MESGAGEVDHFLEVALFKDHGIGEVVGWDDLLASVIALVMALISEQNGTFEADVFELNFLVEIAGVEVELSDAAISNVDFVGDFDGFGDFLRLAYSQG